MFEYYVDRIKLCHLPHVLKCKGKEGWRLHTSDINDKHEYVFIVMDRFIANDDTELENNEQKNEAMACKG